MRLISWFRERLRNREPTFRYNDASGFDHLEGRRVEGTGDLFLIFQIDEVSAGIRMDKASALKLRHWMDRVYPREDAPVIQLHSKP